MNRPVPAVALAALAALAAACGRKSETLTVKTSGGSMNIAAGDSGVALPAEFPKDVPLTKGAVVKAVMGSPEQGNLIVMAQVPDAKYADVFAAAQNDLKEQGWKTESKMDNGQGGMLNLKKDARDLMLTVAAEGKNVNVQYALPNAKTK